MKNIEGFAYQKDLSILQAQVDALRAEVAYIRNKDAAIPFDGPEPLVGGAGGSDCEVDR